VLDRSHGAFVDFHFQRNAVARLRYHFGIDRSRVATLGNVLALQLVTNTFEGGALEDFTFRQTGLLEALHQVLGGDRLVALDLDTGDGRALDDRDHQNVAFAAQLDILKETGFEQRTSGFHQATIIRLLADVQRQGTKHATRGDPLEAVDANIRDSEGLGVNFGDHQYGENRS